MSRRSARLMSAGYYQSDDDSDSSNPSVSYRERISVREFNKRRTGGRKTATSPVSSQAINTPTTEKPINAEDYPGMAPALRAVLQRRLTFRPPAAVPVLTPAVAPAQAPSLALAPALVLAPALAPDQSPPSSAFSSSYYSSDRASTSTTTTSTKSRRSLLSPPAAPAVPLFTDGVKKAIFHVLLLLLLTLGFWCLFPMLTAPTQNLTLAQPVPRTPLVPQSPGAMDGTADMNSVLDDEMNRILREIDLLKQNQHQQTLSEMVQKLQTDVKEARVRVERVDSEHRVQMDQELADLRADLQRDQASTRSVTTRLTREVSGMRRVTSMLRQRVETQEVRSATLVETLAKPVQKTPPQACPPAASSPVNTGLTQELKEAMEKWFTDRLAQDNKQDGRDGRRPMADSMPDFALESQGASVVNSRCSETYHTRSACLTLFGFPLLYPSESPRTVIQGNPVLLPGKCWPFQGSRGTMAVSLSHPITITHVTLDHLPRSSSPNGHIHSAPKDFHVYGMSTDSEEGTLLGKFTYDQDGEPTQTFKLPNPNGSVYRFVELRVLSNWGQPEYTCMYRFRVHGRIAV